MSEPRYRIRTAAQLSGLTTHVIRSWERRYHALSPSRTGGGARLYSDADVERLRLLKRAVDHGHAIGQVANLERDVLLRLALPGEASAPAPEASSLQNELVEAVRALDLVRAEQVVTQASVALSPRALVVDVLAPTLHRVGDEWAAGKLCVASEHAATNLIRDRAASMLHAFAPSRAAETILITTPAGELHELGALLAAVIAAMQGYRIAYLGPNLPAAEIALAAGGCGATIVALSLVALEPKKAAPEIEALAAKLPGATSLVIGGALASSVAGAAGREVVALSTLKDFADWLQARSGGYERA